MELRRNSFRTIGFKTINYNRTNMELRLWDFLAGSLSTRCFITIEPIWNWDRTQNRRELIFVLSITIEPIWNWDLYIFNRENILSLYYNRTNMELRRRMPLFRDNGTQNITIEPIWNWDTFFFMKVWATYVTLQSNQYGIETFFYFLI